MFTADRVEAFTKTRTCKLFNLLPQSRFGSNKSAKSTARTCVPVDDMPDWSDVEEVEQERRELFTWSSERESLEDKPIVSLRGWCSEPAPSMDVDETRQPMDFPRRESMQPRTNVMCDDEWVPLILSAFFRPGVADFDDSDSEDSVGDVDVRNQEKREFMNEAKHALRGLLPRERQVTI